MIFSAVDKSSSEQQFCKSDAIAFVVCKIWSYTPSASRFYERQAGSQMILEDFIIKYFILNCLMIALLGF